MLRLIGWWYSLSLPPMPASPDVPAREKHRKARLLSIVLLAVIIITIFVFIGSALAQEIAGVAVVAIFWGLIGVAVALNRRGWLYIAAAYFLSIFVILTAGGLELDAQTAGSSFLWDWMALTIVPIIAGFVLPFWAPLLFAGLDILILSVMYTHQFPFGNMLLGTTDQIDLITFMIFLTGLVAILSSIYSHNVKQGVKALDRTVELEAANHALEATRSQLQHLSITDPLTGICNQRAFYAATEVALTQAREADGHVAILFLDGDHFKRINDVYGHAVGDATLRAIAQHVQQALREGDLVARYGGEEFAVLLPATDQPQACAIAERIRAAIAMTPVQEGVAITVSIGVATFPADGGSLADVIKHADQAMYAAKQQGRNRVCCSGDASHAPQPETASVHDERTLTPESAVIARMLVTMLTLHEASLDEHSHTVHEWVAKLAAYLELPLEEQTLIVTAALLHDIGKVGIPTDLLLKPGKLTAAEWQIMQQHPVIGESILAQHPSLRPLLPLIRHHHERWDGTGYPDGLQGTAIPLGSRLITVVDAFVVITEVRAYKTARSVATAMSELRRCAGTQFDPQIVAAFLAIIATDEAQQHAA